MDDEDAISTRLTRVETKLDMMLQRIDNVYNDHENRIRKLEARVWVASGFATAMGGGLGLIIQNIIYP